MVLKNKIVSISFILIFFQSCFLLNRFVKNPSNKLNEDSSGIKIYNPSEEFVDLKSRKSEVYFIDELKPEGHIIVIDSLTQDSLIKILIVSDTIIKNSR